MTSGPGRSGFPGPTRRAADPGGLLSASTQTCGPWEGPGRSRDARDPSARDADDSTSCALGWPGPPRVGGAAGRSQMCSPTAPAPLLTADSGSGFRGFNCLYRRRRDPRRWTRTRAGCRRRPQTKETTETVRQPPITMIKAAATQMDSHVLVTSRGRGMAPAVGGSSASARGLVRTRRSLTALFDRSPIRRERNGSADHPQPVIATHPN
jgi:hypothetical protein